MQPLGGVLAWRPLTAADFPLLAKWLREPQVARWWNHGYSAEAVERDFGASARGEEPGASPTTPSTASTGPDRNADFRTGPADRSKSGIADRAGQSVASVISSLLACRVRVAPVPGSPAKPLGGAEPTIRGVENADVSVVLPERTVDAGPRPEYVSHTA